MISLPYTMEKIRIQEGLNDTVKQSFWVMSLYQRRTMVDDEPAVLSTLVAVGTRTSLRYTFWKVVGELHP